MEESILTSIKKLLGITEEYTPFDVDIIMHINSVLFILYQLGVGNKPFTITDSSDLWEDFLGESTNLELIKSYIYLKVRLLFDPPQNGTLMEAMKQNISELEFRISVEVDPGNE